MPRLLLTFLVALVGLGTTIQVRADDDDDDDRPRQSQRLRDEQKRQDEFSREQQKREREYLREQRKREDKEAREQAKRQRELFDRGGDSGRFGRDRYAGGDYAKQLREERKRRDEFLREQQKREQEFGREQRKREDEEWYEQSKRQRELLDGSGGFERFGRGGSDYRDREYGDFRGREFRSYSGASYYGRPDYRYGDRYPAYGYRYSDGAYSSPDRRRSQRFQLHIESGCAYPPGW